MAAIIGVFGMDGAGKTTFAQGLAERIGGQYRYHSEGNPLAEPRHKPRGMNSQERFNYFLALNLSNMSRLMELAEKSEYPIVVDRVPLDTYATHVFLPGVDTTQFEIAKEMLLAPYSALMYMCADEHVREQRLQDRTQNGFVSMDDRFSLDYADEIHTAYLSMLPVEKTILLDNSALSITGTLDKGQLELRRSGLIYPELRQRQEFPLA